MKDIGNILLGIFVLTGMISLVLVLVALSLSLIYAMGYFVGWILVWVAVPSVVFGMQTKVFMGMAFIISSMITSSFFIYKV